MPAAGLRHGVELLMDLLHDLRLTVRNLLKSPGYTSAAIVTLALAMGATSAIFSAVHAILLAPLPIEAPENLIVGWGADSARDRAVLELPFRTIEEMGAASQSLERVASMGSTNWTMVQESDGDPVRVPFAGVSASFFDTLGARAFMGRTFRPEDEAPNQPRVVVLNYGAWVRRFGANPGVVGSTVKLDDQLHTVIGVMPKGFDFPRSAELWAPVRPILAASSAQWNTDAVANVGVLFLVGRLRDGVTPIAASQELSRLKTTTPRFGSTVVVTPFLDYLIGPVRPALWLLFAAVVVLLLIACANVSALMLTRVTARRREHAVRLALGATRGGLGRLWILESIVLAVAGGALGLLASSWMAAGIVALAPDDLPRATEIAINVPVAAFAFVAISMTTLLCGLAPVRFAGRAQIAEALNDASRGSTQGRQPRRTRSLLLTFQMGLAVVLLVSAGLVLRSFANLRQLDLGFDPSNVLTLEIEPRGITASPNRWFERLIEQIAALPQVEKAGAVYLRPLALGAIGQGTFVRLEGQPDTPEAARENPTLNYQVATPGYFETMRIGLLRGRLFDARDTPQSEPVAIVDDMTARRLWPGQDPIGKRLGMPTFTPGERQTVWRTVVGVVADVRYRGLDDSWLDVYDAATQATTVTSNLVIRTSADPLALAATVQTRARELDTRAVIDGITTMEAVVSRAIAPWRLSAWMLSLFAGLAFLLATVGLFSLVSLEVSSRRHEFAVRLAVGALGRDILRAVLARASLQVSAGIGLGLIGALAGTRALQSLLFGIEWIDTATYVAVVLLVIVVVAVAAYLPARRASRIEPLALLRRD